MFIFGKPQCSNPAQAQKAVRKAAKARAKEGGDEEDEEDPDKKVKEETYEAEEGDEKGPKVRGRGRGHGRGRGRPHKEGRGRGRGRKAAGEKPAEPKLEAPKDSNERKADIQPEAAVASSGSKEEVGTPRKGKRAAKPVPKRERTPLKASPKMLKRILSPQKQTEITVPLQSNKDHTFLPHYSQVHRCYRSRYMVMLP